MGSRRQFTKEFKLAAVRRLEQGTSMAEVARGLEVRRSAHPRHSPFRDQLSGYTAPTICVATAPHAFATPDRSAFEVARVACELAMQYRDADTVHLVLDNLNIHCLKYTH